MKKSLLIFDFDGTIADTLQVAVEIVNELAQEFNFPQISAAQMPELKHLPPGELMKLSGISWMQLPLLIKRAHKLFRKHFKHVTPIAGMPEVIRALHQNGYKMGILTSNSKDNVEDFLKEHDLDYFEFVRSPKSLFGKAKALSKIMDKYELPAESLVMIGDEIRDLDAAREAGIESIGVGWGFNSAESLRAVKPSYVLERPSELLQLF